MKSVKYYLVVCATVFIGLISACHNSKSPSKTIAKEDTLKLIKSAIIRVVSDDAGAQEYTAITDFNIMPNTSDFYSKNIKNDTLTFTIDAIYKSHILSYTGVGDTNYYRTKIVVSPGDNVLLTIKNNTLAFIGKNAANYNFYNQLDSTVADWSQIPYKGDLHDYKQRCKSNFLKRQQFLETYAAKNNVSDDFKALVGAELQQEYLWNLMAPRSISFQDGLVYINSLENLTTFIAKDYNVEKDGVFNLEAYFDFIKLQDFNKSEQLNSRYGRYNLISFLRQYFLNSEYTIYSKSKFLEEKRFIQENFKSDVETYAIARLLLDYYKNGFGITKETKKLLEKTLDAYYATFSKDKSYKEKIDELKFKLDNYGLQLSDAILETKLINLKSDTLSLASIFNKSKNKIKVIDFWASWCLPCIDEVQKSQGIRNNLSKNDQIDLIYISIDDNKSAWINTSNKLEAYGMLQNQYLLPNYKATELYQYLKVKSIPRYVIVNKQNEIVIGDSPRPTDSINFNRTLIDLLMNN